MTRIARRIVLTAIAAVAMTVPAVASADTLNSSPTPQTREHILLAKCTC